MVAGKSLALGTADTMDTRGTADRQLLGRMDRLRRLDTAYQPGSLLAQGKRSETGTGGKEWAMGRRPSA